MKIRTRVARFVKNAWDATDALEPAPLPFPNPTAGEAAQYAPGTWAILAIVPLTGLCQR